MTARRKQFKTEVQKLLDLVIHSLYTHKEIFLRELISNASDAIDRARFLALSDKAIVEDDPVWKIRLAADREARTLTVSDNGIGMTAAEMERNIGTIASSGTRHFLEELQQSGGATAPELIGQFGVGFYSAFMVADKVTVVSRQAGGKTGARWVSDGQGSYTIEDCEKERRGTDVTLHLKEDMDEYLEEWRLRKIVKTYSDFVEHPVVMNVTRPKPGKEDAEAPADQGKEAEPEVETVEETLNSQKAIWTRAKAEVSAENYHEFYKHIAHDFQDPLRTIHWSAEGKTEFRALLFIPAKAPFDLYMPESHKRGVQLYVRRVFITDNCEALVPGWLRFLRGVVDSADLPLNVSRETLQEERVIRIIRSNLVKKILDTLAEMKEKERPAYDTFWTEFGKVLKEGIHLELGSREELQALALFESSKTDAGKYVSLDEYIARMPAHQKDIYYLTGDSRTAVEQSPLLETCRASDVEVLFLTDPIDEWVVQSTTSYKEKKLVSVAKGDIEIPSAQAGEKKEAREETETTFKELAAFLKDRLKDKVKDVRVSRRLTESACCLVSGEQDLGVHMERILRSMHADLPAAKRILELNPAHALVTAMNAMVKDSRQHLRLAEYADLLYDQARLTAGMEIANPVEFAQRVSRIMAAAAEGEAAPEAPPAATPEA
ncbi:MAG: Chaperone protein HtpG [Lentisphaerae bacterium ADurb.BinA184]|nr:MAG: Chaperone protein HtpG [Lentisphaerae bacterium ADurb.BinA184]